jgi:serine phosphatase RsbU (regulator of sigma subunit)
MAGLKSMSNLYIYPKEGDVFDFLLKARKISIGRSSKNDIPLQDPFCSGTHAFFFPLEDGFALQDNNSKNGTFLNGKRIQKDKALKRGDEILVGSTRIVFDKEIASNVEITGAPSPTANIETIINVDDVLKKHDISTTIWETGRPPDFARVGLDNRYLSIIKKVSENLILHQPIDELLDHIMNLINNNLPMDRGVLMRKEGNPAQFISKVVRINNQRFKNQKIQVSQSIINRAIKKNSSLLISEVKDDSQLRKQPSVLGLKIKSAMCVPMYNNREITGLIYVDRISLKKRFRNEDLLILTLLANMAAVKIENALAQQKRIEGEISRKQLELARNFQRKFLPITNPVCEKFEMAGKNVPCYEVGGDYYDFIDIDEDRMAVTIADVSGKGFPAAIHMSGLRQSLHAQVSPSHNLKELIEKVNDLIHGTTESNTYITFFYGELNKNSGEFFYINAGHFPPIVINKKGQVKRLEACGFCLGMFPVVDYEVREMKLEIGDTALLFTDGITECRNKAGGEYTEERLIKGLRKNRRFSAERLCDKIFDEVNAFGEEAERIDDMTLVVVKRVC